MHENKNKKEYTLRLFLVLKISGTQEEDYYIRILFCVNIFFSENYYNKLVIWVISQNSQKLAR